MPSPQRARATSRAAANTRSQVIQQLKDDHKRVRKAYRDFQKLDRDEDGPACEAIVQQVLQELSVHAALEEELLYPAARTAIADEDLIDEAEVEHETMHGFIDQLRHMRADDERYAARFTVLCEYVLHHVKEEEGEIFPQLERSRLDWESLAAGMDERRRELAPVEDRGSAGTRRHAQRSAAADDDDMAVEQGSGDGRAGTPRRPSDARRV